MNGHYTARAKDNIADARRIVECQILKTPTGAERNLLTDANIHLAAAEQALTKALAASDRKGA